MRKLFLYVSFSVAVHTSIAQKAVSDFYRISSKEKFTALISPLLYSNFIELGYGVQVEPMCSEMFFNRSFEYFHPYKVINKLWYDLYNDEKDLSKGYEKDWSKFDWYHSGYEHNAWFAAPNNIPKASIIEDSSTFIITSTPLRKITLTAIKGGSGHGTQYLRADNLETAEWGAVAQEGKLFKIGETYQFKGMLKAAKAGTKVEVRLYPQGKWDRPIAIIPVASLDTSFTERVFSFVNKDFIGYVTFSLWIEPQASVSMDDFSMKPANSYYGWRPDVVDAFKQLKPGVVRFPGGCFASFYDWMDGVGPYSGRKPGDSYFWGGQNYNDVGTAEFAMLCKAAGSEMSMCVNMYHPSKRKYEVDFVDWQAPHEYNFPQFMSLSEGARHTADWVAYCNLPVGTHPMANLRAKHGYTAPFGVKYWELDNEVNRWFESDDYALAAVVYSKAMKAVDPTIKIGLSSYGARSGKKEFHEVIDDMLEIAGPYIDFLADRGDAADISAYMVAKVKTYNAKHGTHIKYCDTEWLAYNTEEKRDAYNMAERKSETSKSFAFSKWMYGLNLAKNFLSFQRLGEEVDFVNFNNLANTHSQSALETPKEGAYLTASGKVLELFSHSPAGWLLDIDGYQPKPKDEYQVQAAWDNSRIKLVIFICNRSADKHSASFDLSLLQKKFTVATSTQLIADSPVAMNTLQNQQAIKKLVAQKKLAAKGNSVFNVPAYSFTEIVLE